MIRPLLSFAQKQASTHVTSLMGLLLTLSACSGALPSGSTPPPVAVRTVEVRERTLRSALPFVGTVRSIDEVTLLAQAPGTIASLAEDGARVAEGAVLATLDAPELGARLARGRAELSRAEEERGFACKKMESDRRLAAIGALSAWQWEASQKGCASSTQIEAAARASVRELALLHAKRAELAPFAGTVLSRHAEVGGYAAPGRPLLTLGGERLELRLEASEADVMRGIQPGAKVSIRLGDGSQLISAVHSVASSAKGPGRLVEVRIPLQAALPIRHGSSVDLEIVLSEADHVAAIPLAALREVGENSFVFSIEDDTARKVPTLAGLRSDGWVQVPRELLGSRVAISNLSQLHDGAPVFAVAADDVDHR